VTVTAGGGPAPSAQRIGSRADGRGRAQAFAALTLLAAVWGYSWVMVKVATRDASPIAVAALRNGLGAAALLVFLAATRRPLRPPPFGPTAVYGLLQTVGFTALQTIAVSLGGAGRIAILAYTMPFWLALLAWPLLGERIGGARWGALAIAAAGLWLVAGPTGTRSGLASLLGVASGLLWAASTVWVVRTLIRRGHDLLSVTLWQMVWGGAVLTTLALLFPGDVRWTASLAGSLAFLAIASNALGWALWVFVLSRLPAATAGLGSLATPVVGVALAAAQLHEIPSRGELLGMVLVVAALVVNARATAGRRA
jgi:drug/metabolite transporter (DMT)-like permease